MLDVHYWPTPNCWKVTIALEEMRLPYRVIPVNIRSGAQHEPAYRAVCPNERVPSLVDHEVEGGGPAIAVFESGAILQYLAEKSGQLMPRERSARYRVLSWLTFQVANIGPVAGQVRSLRDMERESDERTLRRLTAEMERLYGVLDDQLAQHEFIAGQYSIADIAIWPFILPYERANGSLRAHPHVERWAFQLLGRAAVLAGMDVGAEHRPGGPLHARVSELLCIGRGKAADEQCTGTARPAVVK